MHVLTAGVQARQCAGLYSRDFRTLVRPALALSTYCSDRGSIAEDD